MIMIGNEVKREFVELSAVEKEINVLSVEKFTEISTGRFFFVYQFSKGFIQRPVRLTKWAVEFASNN